MRTTINNPRIQWRGNNKKDIEYFCGKSILSPGFIRPMSPFSILSKFDIVTVNVDDWIIQGVDGEYYKITNELYRALY